jgi:membrane associated rhomboid family serine protease
MEPAAVGFQCPDCVATGHRQTRSGRTAYGGERSGNPALTSMVIIGINVAVWLLIVVTGWQASVWADWLSLVPDGVCAADGQGGFYPGIPTEAICEGSSQISGTWVPGVAEGSWWQLVTSMFTHVDIWHIGFNMLALWVLGPQLELVIGRARFLALYLLSGLVGSAFVYWLADERSMTLGASGAVYGLMAALLVVAFKVGGRVQTILGWIIANAVLTVLFGFSWQGHLGGFLGGLAMMVAIVYAPRERRTQVQATVFTLVGVAVAVAIAVRTAVLT